jgi:hypothetical protein
MARRSGLSWPPFVLAAEPLLGGRTAVWRPNRFLAAEPLFGDRTAGRKK